MNAWFHFLYYWLSFAFRAWFKRVYYHHDAPLPDDGPIIYACTHPNSAIDYLFAPLITVKPTFVLVRGDVFEKKILNAIFRSIYMLPVYRIRDGFSSLNKNEKSFKDCYREFDNNGRVLIFSEGVCVQEKTLQPIRKGTARLALDYIHKHGGKKMYVVPIATNYSRYRWFRSTVMVNFGTPIEASKYDDLYAVNANKAYEALTADITGGLQKRFIEVENYKDDHLTETALMALRLNRLETRRNWLINDFSVFQEERALVDKLNANPELLSSEWYKKAESLELNAHREGFLKQHFRGELYLFQLIILSPFIALAYLTVALPYGITRWLINNKVKDIIFDTTVTVYGTLVFYLIQLLIITLVSIGFMGIAGIFIPLAWVLFSALGVEIVDEYLFALKNWKKLDRKEAYQSLYQEVRSLIK